MEDPTLSKPTPKVKRTNSRRQDRWEVVQSANTPEMTKKKMKICPIGSWRGRRATFMKRKIGLLKKARELSVLCGNTVSIVMTDLHGQVVTFESAEGDLDRLYGMHASGGAAEKFTNQSASLSGEAHYSDSEEGSVHSVESNEGGWRSSQNNSPDGNTPTAAAEGRAFQSLAFSSSQGSMSSFGGSWRSQSHHGGSSSNLNPGGVPGVTFQLDGAHRHHLDNPRAQSAPGPDAVHVPGNLPVWQHSPHHLPPQPGHPAAPPPHLYAQQHQGNLQAAMSQVNNLSLGGGPSGNSPPGDNEIDPDLQHLLLPSGAGATPPQVSRQDTLSQYPTPHRPCARTVPRTISLSRTHSRPRSFFYSPFHLLTQPLSHTLVSGSLALWLSVSLTLSLALSLSISLSLSLLHLWLF